MGGQKARWEADSLTGNTAAIQAAGNRVFVKAAMPSTLKGHEMFTRSLKAVPIATLLTIATAGASFAAQWAWVERDAVVRLNHKSSSPGVNSVDGGDKVRVIAAWGSWYKIKIPGTDGWVRASVLDFDPEYWDYPDHPGHPHIGGSGCVGGDNASFCLGSFH